MPKTLRPLAFATVSLTVLAFAAEARGWGRIGHRASARLCETLLTPKSKAEVAKILAGGESLADASTWPDEHRRERPETAPWHYVNVNIIYPKYDIEFSRGGLVVPKIHDFQAVLMDPKASPDARREALRFLVHLVQDIHQPVHVGDRDDRGGNDLQVRFFGQGSNLHRVWDSGLIEHALAPGVVGLDPEQVTLDRLRPALTAGFRRAVEGGTVESWADESLAAARDAYVKPDGKGNLLRPGDTLGDAYQALNLPVAERRLLQASVRLARLLNEALDPGGVAPDTN